MRKIENIIANEFYTLMKSEETECILKHLSIRDIINFTGNDYITKVRYRLWGNTVLKYTYKNELIFSFCGYMTNTTKSRLNAILFYLSNISLVYDFGGFFQKNYELFWQTKNGIAKKIDASKKYRFVLSDDSVDIEIV